MSQRQPTKPKRLPKPHIHQCPECGAVCDSKLLDNAIGGLRRQIDNLQQVWDDPDPRRRQHLLSVTGVSFTDMLTDMKEALRIISINQ